MYKYCIVTVLLNICKVKTKGNAYTVALCHSHIRLIKFPLIILNILEKKWLDKIPPKMKIMEENRFHTRSHVRIKNDQRWLLLIYKDEIALTPINWNFVTNETKYKGVNIHNNVNKALITQQSRHGLGNCQLK